MPLVDAPVMDAPVMDAPAIEITHIGGPSTRVSIDGLTFLIDPTFDPAGQVYSIGAVRLSKLRGPAIPADRIGRIDVGLVSHDQHPDNLDTLGRAVLNGVPMILTTQASAARLGSAAVGLAPWESRTIRTPGGLNLRVTATPARHGPRGAEHITGEVTGFVITAVQSGEDLVYATGDTVWFEGVAEVAKRFTPRVVLLFGGAAMPRGPFHVTMSTNDAIEATAAFERSKIVPVHSDGWAHITQSTEDFTQALRALGYTDRLTVLTMGEPTLF